jgi:alpha-ketoglutarate-dependent taurine dioxygenase
MKISKIPGLGRFGIFVDNVDFDNITNEEWMEIGKLHMQNLVTIIRNTNLSKEKQLELTNLFGERRYGAKHYFLKKYKLPWDTIIFASLNDDNIISKTDRITVKTLIAAQEKTENGLDITRVSGGYDENGLPKGFFAEGELLWHSNESGTLTASPGVSLLAVQNVIGSATGFVTTPDYYESVSESFRNELDEMILIHRFTPGRINPGLNADQDEIMHINMCPDDGKEIPMVITSPGGVRGLHYSINTVWAIKGASKKESDKIFEKINKELFTEKYIYDHWYKNNGDFLLFDNSITMHRRLGDIKDRLCYRVQHDYTNLQDSAWYPYSQKYISKQYEKEIRDFVKVSGIKNFKLPPKRISDYIPFVG